ncbi:GntR family transcriptional regulator [Actinomadura darangshiensis]|uniref:GntR family transcriptional regulator n=1 Tax=Actinomadura darangshiensis TaxID=705336 RepID=A0A4R5BDK5_9ACTN|nr:GntR family transcriptional regulator [Actinomadura darangshiensis]
MPSLGPRQNVRERVAEALRAAIVTGEMRPGVVYSAPAIADRFGVSATPVREAMIDLAGEGLIGVVRNKGFRITELSDRELDEITEVRALIEVPAVVHVARTGRMADIRALRPLAAAIMTAARRRDVIAYIEADHRFHLEPGDLSGTGELMRHHLRHIRGIWADRRPPGECG